MVAAGRRPVVPDLALLCLFMPPQEEHTLANLYADQFRFDATIPFIMVASGTTVCGQRHRGRGHGLYPFIHSMAPCLFLVKESPWSVSVDRLSAWAIVLAC